MLYIRFYYSSLTFHWITALYVKHSPSILASGPAWEALKQICFKQHTALLFMRMTSSTLEAICSVPDTGATVIVYMPGVKLIMWPLFTLGINIVNTGWDTHMIFREDVKLHGNASSLRFQKNRWCCESVWLNCCCHSETMMELCLCRKQWSIIFIWYLAVLWWYIL